MFRQLLLLALLSGVASAQSAPDPVRALFIQHCARCHGPEGRGDGETKVYPPARDFTQGGFSFGNSPDAIVRTITSGIPGTPMTPFGDVLAAPDRRALAQYVLSLVPEEARKPVRGSRLVVGGRPVIARGYLPSDEEQRSLARGLAVGLPGGFSFFYQSDDLRLLEVRRGPFVDRSDWRDRGGSPLLPLGEVFRTFPGERVAFAVEYPAPPGSGPLPVPVRGRLCSTHEGGRFPTLRYRLVDRLGEITGRVAECLKVDTVRDGLGFVREFSVSGRRPDEYLDLVLPLPEAGTTPGAGWPEGAPLPVGEVHWLVCSRADGSYDGLMLEAPEGSTVEVTDLGPTLRVPPVAEDVTLVRLGIVRIPAVDEEVLEAAREDLQ